MTSTIIAIIICSGLSHTAVFILAAILVTKYRVRVEVDDGQA